MLKSELSRRDLLRVGLAGSGLFAAGTLGACSTESTSSSPAGSQGRPIEPGAGRWKTWVLGGGRQFRPPAPPNADSTKPELASLRALVKQRDSRALQQVTYWNAGTPAYHWLGVNLDQINQGKGPGKGANASRHIALVNVAMYDAAVATWDAKFAYRRPRPGESDPGLATAIPSPRSPSYPSEYASIGSAAVTVLSHLYPQDADRFSGLLRESTQSRLLAGVEHPSDLTAGLDLGRRVGELFVERAKSDGFDQKWTGTVPTGPGLWNGADPVYPLAGAWKTWALPAPDQFRSGPPPASDSAQRAAELDEVQQFRRTFDTNAMAFRAQSFENFLSWYRIANQTMFEDRTYDNPPRAARAYALMSIAHHDAMVAGWDSKYSYWTARPSMFRAGITTLFANPNHPSYPSAHGFESAAISEVMAYLFPSQADAVRDLAHSFIESRVWAGIHFRSDLVAGTALGKAVAQVVVERARTDGSG